MNIILDTHTFIWWNENPAKLSKPARETIENKDNIIYISTVVIWEIIVKMMLGKLEAPPDPLAVALSEGFIPLPITGEHALALKTLESYHNDPFDRLLIAQAKHEDFILLTHDKMILKYKGFKSLKA